MNRRSRRPHQWVKSQDGFPYEPFAWRCTVCGKVRTWKENEPPFVVGDDCPGPPAEEDVERRHQSWSGLTEAYVYAVPLDTPGELPSPIYRAARRTEPQK